MQEPKVHFSSPNQEDSAVDVAMHKTESLAAQSPHSPSVSQPTEPAAPSYSTRNLITLLNFDPAALASRDIQRRIIFGMKTPREADKKAAKTSAASCAITSAPAKYRDPATMLPYANMDGFRSIRRLLDKGAVWSDLLGAWVGSETKTGKAAEIWTTPLSNPAAGNGESVVGDEKGQQQVKIEVTM